LEDGNHTLLMHPLYRWVGYLSIVLGVVLGTLSLTFYGLTAEGFLLFALFIGLFCGLGIPCLLLSRNHYAIINEQELIVSDQYGRDKRMQWEDIVHAKFNPMSGFVKLKSKTESVKLHWHLVGLASFVRLLKQKTDWTPESIGLPVKEENSKTA